MYNGVIAVYKFVAIDIDGTLLNSKGELSERTKKSVEKVIQKGVKIVLTSGRVTNSVEAVAKSLNVDKYLICDNGASIYDVTQNKTIWSKEIDKKTVENLVNTCIENNIYYMVFTDEEIIVKDLRHMALAFYKQRHNCKDEASGITQFRYAGIEYIQKLQKPVRRIVVCDQDRVIYNSIVKKLCQFDDIELLASPHISNKIIKDDDKTLLLRYSYAEILPKNANKWIAIKELITRIGGIEDSEVIAIGDNFNDVSMLKNAGLGVAMNNGASVAKEVARVVAPSNDEDGVALILERYILNK